MTIDIVSPVINMIYSLSNFATCRVQYIVGLEDDANSLRNAMDELRSVREDVKRRVDIAERRLLTRTNQVQGWLQRVDAIEHEVDEVDEGLVQRRRCIGDWCPDCWSRYKLGKKVVKLLAGVAELKSRGVFDEVAERSLPNPVNEVPSTSPVGTSMMLEKLRRFVREDGVGIVGVYGMGGVGKTTLLKKINNKFLERTHDFDVVIWVVVSKDLNVGKIQKALGGRLGLSWEGSESQEERAVSIFAALNKTKFMLLLDDVWGRLDLDVVGIPFPNSHNKCKIVFTTRSMDVCSDMDAQRKLKVEFLEEKEAWKLFQAKVGKEMDLDSQSIRPLAETTVKKCGGLPLALITIGRAMANKKSIEEWKDAIRSLNNSASELRGMEDVFSLLKFSYDSLTDDTVRSCFLYCALFPEDYSIEKEQLIEYWIGEGFLDGFRNISEVHNKGHAIIGSLKVACLLESGDEETQVKMHDVIRGLAIWIACQSGKTKKFIVQASVGLTEHGVERWTEVERISLMDNEINALVEGPNCPNLLTMMLQWNNSLNKISNSFFHLMPALRVLDLSFTSLKELPGSIGGLVKLRYLNLSRTKITALPKELGSLGKLRHLDVQRTRALRTVPYEVISNLSGLQVLNLYYSFGDWDVEGVGDGSGVSFTDLECLQHLTTLGITITKAIALFRYCFGNLPKRTAYLYIKECEGLTYFELSLNHRKLRRLSINNCYDLEELTVRSEGGEDWLPSLEVLSLYGLPNITTIWGRTVTHECLQYLRCIDIWYCDKLKNITWILQLQCLEVIYLFYCKGMEELVSGDVVVEVPFALPRLRTISIRDLPELRRIYTQPLVFPSLEGMAIAECPKLKKLPLGSCSAKTLRTIYGNKEWWDGLEWEDDSIKSAFLPYFTAI
ncbi:LOW QUALITY PROTEIN: disease resistance protein RPS2 [Magnolia sinica]|uniref:LOW QUALITY PROTEIN: disease resistance protein RPS2 n=1 Tax=Magnolia sinica TaxID=86752 RepID=UPI0026599993|nr:LOW QUALITY PROTEIN: disease resistance protein RPS2 [Magnolia sinica]